MIELKTYAGSNVTPQNDAIMNDTNTLNNGIYYGCNVTIKDATTLHINSGQGIVYGRLFEVLDSDIPVSLSPSGTLLGQLYVHIDLSNIAAPIQILVDTGETLADLEDDPQLNIDSGITDMQLATFTVSTVGMSDLVETFAEVEPIRAVLGDADISAIGDGSVKGAIRTISTHLTASDNLTFRFASDGEGNHGYLGADDSFIPFKSGYQIIEGLTDNNSHDALQIVSVSPANVSHLPASDFYKVFNGMTGTGWYIQGTGNITVTLKAKKALNDVKIMSQGDMASRIYAIAPSYISACSLPNTQYGNGVAIANIPADTQFTITLSISPVEPINGTVRAFNGVNWILFAYK